jgi:hypothetical protein
MLTFITGVIARVVGEAMHHTFITTKDPPACVCVCVCNAARLLLRRSLSHSTLSVTNNVSRRITIFIKNENYCLSKTHAAAFVLLLPGALLSLSPPSVCIYSARLMCLQNEFSLKPGAWSARRKISAVCFY